jgi:hypothetical protein
MQTQISFNFFGYKKEVQQIQHKNKEKREGQPPT